MKFTAYVNYTLELDLENIHTASSVAINAARWGGHIENMSNLSVSVQPAERPGTQIPSLLSGVDTPATAENAVNKESAS